MSQRDSQRPRTYSTNPCTTVQDIDLEESNAGSNGPSLSEPATRDDEGDLRSACVVEITCDELSGEDDSNNNNNNNNNNNYNTKKNQRMCRICHLNEKESYKRDDKDKALIELGCGCKGELGFAHSDCADSWFKVRGNRLCEICNETAANVAGVSSGVRFMESDNGVTRLSDERYYMENSNRRFFGGQTLCNFLMACLVIAFILPWFLRIDVF